MRTLILFAVLAFGMLTATTSFAAERESYYSNLICSELYHGSTETLPSGLRPDCQTEFVVIEFDWSVRMKHYECIGQALVYATETGKFPVCVLLARNDEELAFGHSITPSPLINVVFVVIDTRQWDPME